MPRPQADQIRAVVFDAYGTLVEITDKRRPYKQLQELIPPGSTSRDTFGRIVMSEPLDLEDAALHIGITLPPAALIRMQLDLTQELASIRSFDDVPDCLSALRTRGLKLAICSNLAAPYAQPVKQLTGIAWDVTAWSFEVGAIKPQHAIYTWLCERLNLPPCNVLMIGDTENEDYLGPVQFGMQAIRLRRQLPDHVPASIQSLAELPGLIEPMIP